DTVVGMRLTSSPAELTTAATDAALGILCAVLAIWLLRLKVTATWKRGLWAWVLALTAVGSMLGAAAHGLDSQTVQAVIWEPLYLSIGLAVALFVAGAVYDWKDERTARAATPWLLATGVAFFASTHVAGGTFLIFVVYEAAAMVAALAIYLVLSIG